VLSGARTGTTNFTAYISPYMVVGNGGQLSKHIYMGSQRIVSKLCNSGSMDDPTQIAKAGAKDFTTNYAELTGKVKTRYDSLGVTYRGTDNRAAFYVPASTTLKENQQYFYHSDHLGSSSLITDVDGNEAQHIEYIPFGEVFIDERNTTWTTPYKFNAKELDEETGLYYYGARYYDPETSVWISVDPLAEKYPGISPYAYCAGNPIIYIDPDGRLKIKFSASIDLTSGIFGLTAKVFGIGIQAKYLDGVKNGFKIYAEFDTKTKNVKFGAERSNKMVKGHELTVGPLSEQKMKEKTIKGSGDVNTKDGYTKTETDKELKSTKEEGGFGPIKSDKNSEIEKLDFSQEVNANAGLVGIELKTGLEITDIPKSDSNDLNSQTNNKKIKK